MPRASASAGTSEGAPREVRTEVSRLEQERDSGALACGGSISVNDWLRFDYGANRRGGGLGQPSVDNLFTSVYSGCMSRASEVDYDGIAYEDLTVDSVSWSKVVANHMASRTERYGRRSSMSPIRAGPPRQLPTRTGSSVMGAVVTAPRSGSSVGQLLRPDRARCRAGC